MSNSESAQHPSEYEVKERVLMRLHERAGICGCCGKRKCSQAVGSTLPQMLKLDDVLHAISLDTPLFRRHNRT